MLHLPNLTFKDDVNLPCFTCRCCSQSLSERCEEALSGDPPPSLPPQDCQVTLGLTVAFFHRCSSSTADLDRRGQPIRSLVLAPLALLFDAVLGREPDTDAVLLVVLPLADVLVAIGQDHSAVAVFLASSEVAFVHAPILIGQLALALKQVLGEGAFVGALRFGKVVHAYSNKKRKSLLWKLSDDGLLALHIG